MFKGIAKKMFPFWNFRHPLAQGEKIRVHLWQSRAMKNAEDILILPLIFMQDWGKYA